MPWLLPAARICHAPGSADLAAAEEEDDSHFQRPRTRSSSITVASFIFLSHAIDCASILEDTPFSGV